MTLVNYKASNHPQQTAKRGAKDEVDDRGTDPAFIASLEDRFGKFTLDVAAAEHNAKAPQFYTRKDDGLAMPWGRALWQGRTCVMCSGTGKNYAPLTQPHGMFTEVVGKVERDAPCGCCNGHGREAREVPGPHIVWCNPPYSDCGAWVRKAWDEWSRYMQSSIDAVTDREAAASMSPRPELIVMLLPANRVEQKWWQELVEPHRDRPGSPLRVEFLPGRMRFIRPGWTPGPKGDRPPFGCCLLIWGGDR